MAFPRFHGERDVGPEVQQMIYPYSLQQKDRSKTILRRTAPIKHHLRSQVRNADRLSTYDHDFGRSDDNMGWSSARSVSARTELERAEAILPTTAAFSARRTDPELRNFVAKKKREDTKAGKRHYFQSGGTKTLNEMQRLQETGRGFHINPSGWAGTQFAPAKFPMEFRGGTDRQINIIQKIQTLNLREPDFWHRIT
ncbi:unnamed protein product [Amoebophrya sp. A25]|nr:unnamed protein product [Amoebophrya sp. A25]|eukprot:GSA25T00003576001.1